MTIWRMRVACWISNARRARTHARALAHPPTHTETRTHARLHARTPTEKYVKLNAFPRQLFREGHSVLGCVHTVPLYARWHCQNCWKNRAKWLANSNPTIVSPLQRKPRHFWREFVVGTCRLASGGFSFAFNHYYGCCGNKQILVGIHFATECHFLCGRCGFSTKPTGFVSGWQLTG